MRKSEQETTAKKTFWTIAAFYGLIAFEFFYMASPLAMYFYSAYQPGLNFLTRFPDLVWLTGFFLPHIVTETSCLVINLHNVIGMILVIIGFILFCIAAIQVYYAKLARKGMVAGGLYRYVRHPQYSAFIIFGLGLLLLWPRLLVVPLFSTLLFAYYFLARAEERECSKKYGQAYRDYQNKTHMFLPFGIAFINRWYSWAVARNTRVLVTIAIYILTIFVSLILARTVQKISIASLYTYQAGTGLYVSVTAIEDHTFQSIINTALADSNVSGRLRAAQDPVDTKFLNYIVPAEWYISEIPMQMIETHSEHYLRTGPEKYDICKIIFTRALFAQYPDTPSQVFLTDVLRTIPVAEVWIDNRTNRVISVKDPPNQARYNQIIVPIF